jgi:hypothetical protein
LVWPIDAAAGPSTIASGVDITRRLTRTSCAAGDDRQSRVGEEVTFSEEKREHLPAVRFIAVSPSTHAV